MCYIAELCMYLGVDVHISAAVLPRLNGCIYETDYKGEDYKEQRAG